MNSPGIRRSAARIVTEVLAPAWVVAVLLVAVSARIAPSPATALKWGLLSALFASLLPFAWIVNEVRRRRLTDHHVSDRTQRAVPLLVGILSILLGLGLLVTGRAPRPLVALVIAMLVGLIVTLLITTLLKWKISVHTATLAGAIVIVLLVFGYQLWPVVFVGAVVAWARVELGDHTLLQVVTGEAIGALVAATVFLALR